MWLAFCPHFRPLFRAWLPAPTPLRPILGVVFLWLFLQPSLGLAVSSSPTSQSFYEDALRYVENGEREAAAIQLRNAIQEDPQNDEARVLLGRVRLEMGQPAAAEKELGLALAIRHSDKAEILLGRALLDQFKFEDVIRAISRDALTIESLHEKLLILAEAYWGLDQQKMNEAIYRQILDDIPEHPEARLGIARLFLAGRQRERALREVNDLISLDPDYDPAWVFHGELALLRNEASIGRESFNKALEINPGNFRARINRAWLQLKEGDWSDASHDAGKALDLRPQDPFARYIKSAVAFAQGDYVEASRAIQHVERYLEGERPVRLLGGLIHVRMAAFATAESLLSQYLARQPNNDDARKLLAYVALQNNSVQLAASTLEPLVRRRPDDAAAAQLLTSAYLRLGSQGQASWILQQILENRSFHGERELREVFVRLAARAGVGGWQPTFSKPLMPDDVVTALIPIWSLLNEDMIDEAREKARSLKHRYPDTPFVQTLEGVILTRQGESYAGESAFKRALKFEPQFLPALENLDNLDRDRGLSERIEPRLLELLARAPRSEILISRYIKLLSDAQRFDELETFLERKRALMLDSMLVARALVILNLGRKNFDRVLQILEEIMITGAENPSDLHYVRGLFLELGRPERALYASVLLQGLQPNSVGPLRLAAEAQARAGELTAAGESLERAWSLDPGNRGVARDLANLALDRNDAPAALQAARRLEPYDRIAAVELKSVVLMRSGQTDLALAALERVYEEGPTPNLARDLFLLRVQAGRVDEATDGLRVWLKTRPKDVDSRLLLANMLMEQARLEQADAEYQRLLEIAPNNPLALNNLAWLRHRLGRDGALDLAARAYEFAPRNADVADTYGWLLAQSGRPGEGLHVLRRADSLESGRAAGTRYRLASVLASVGQKAEARSLLQGLLTMDRPFRERSDAEALFQALEDSD